MSGGSMNYVYSRLECDASFREDTIERKAFAEHLKKVVKALHDIEWVESGDYGPGDDTEAIRACLAAGATLATATCQAEYAIAEMVVELDRARSRNGADSLGAEGR